ncbi:hypothetical protein A3C98_02445 [Candidatus Roizmanbacteria bacterium RIFCSPHIGHO2_02_FULL_37_15]|uniref:Probable fructose-bisphosphate aldolase class 1 n=1 Tax=Candidatus Roizmanbacteria bacterium RIFCSPLOWO2_01_FULL_37_16 TaxID=1802058 RepID=A0A1F7INI8_9BACT|nr:MAG: hypothetical protein A2859_01985 [Candidatus Roizmanbacteria bacterium RIFCSPHIGHO2_01_FULL_37_16b]OGK21435.1 MAG: hypothetical protein A3C98_02445 [Candidatus Roizmanbacteria bacterium RIFCSPHIGHO2_02_FULL_37_15]OGK32409.1 MAG: hypothetical protein A3F57_04900 [Candidatus Roizmanbacteria bacterium RIFCSPHIGHO2_12_FULL_36_11]OGK44954.1 MAG: hypothetical protein A3B40_04180 [Candidatus Roizmanbacteria bacterium RIFCSPLOWO2_01_FULL_37_16]
MTSNNLDEIAKSLVAPGKGILAADESTGTMTKRLDAIGVASTVENRSKWREIMATTAGAESAISGVILFDETIRNQLPKGSMIADLLRKKKIHPGIKVDKGIVKFNSDEETFTLGLDGLTERLEEYKKLGAVFTKWRAVYKVEKNLPSAAAITANSVGLAQFALLSQKSGFVPIVEPEVLVLKGSHDLKKSKVVTEKVLKDVFHWLKQFGVNFDSMLLKPNMALPGRDCPNQTTAKEIARATVEVLRVAVPKQVPGIVFLSGGLTPDEATEYLKTMNKIYRNLPWQLSFSFGRALQQEALKAWSGKSNNVKATQAVFLVRAKKVSAARSGK